MLEVPAEFGTFANSIRALTYSGKSVKRKNSHFFLLNLTETLKSSKLENTQKNAILLGGIIHVCINIAKEYHLAPIKSELYNKLLKVINLTPKDFFDKQNDVLQLLKHQALVELANHLDALGKDISPYITIQKKLVSKSIEKTPKSELSISQIEKGFLIRHLQGNKESYDKVVAALQVPSSKPKSKPRTRAKTRARTRKKQKNKVPSTQIEKDSIQLTLKHHGISSGASKDGEKSKLASVVKEDYLKFQEPGARAGQEKGSSSSESMDEQYAQLTFK